MKKPSPTQLGVLKAMAEGWVLRRSPTGRVWLQIPGPSGIKSKAVLFGTWRNLYIEGCIKKVINFETIETYTLTDAGRKVVENVG